VADEPFLALSVPTLTSADAAAVARVVSDGWVGPIGPALRELEDAVADYVGAPHAVAVSSGTAALHLGLLALGIRPDDVVVLPTLTFAATAFASVYVGARVALVDVEPESWNLDPELLARALRDLEAAGTPAKAVMPVDVYGRTYDYNAVRPIVQHYGIPLLEDAAEALGATHAGKSAGTLGEVGVFSFNGNKVITAGGGGMLVTQDEALAATVRYLSTQARTDVHWYEHESIGYNYRMSSLQAALGLSQLGRLDEILARRRHIQALYARELSGHPGISVTPSPRWGEGNAWLTTVLLTDIRSLDSLGQVRQNLYAKGIETRFLWKPLHQQPVFAHLDSWLSGQADSLFGTGLCLPSSANMTDDDVLRVARSLIQALENSNT